MLIAKKIKEINASNTESSIIQFILSHPEEIPYLTIKELASSTYTSPASIMRLCKKLGFTGYSDFKKEFVKEIKSMNQVNSNLTINENENIVSIIKKMEATSIHAIQTLKEDIEFRELNKIIQMIEQSTYIDIYASGTDLQIAKYFMNGLMQLGFDSSAHTSTNQRYAQAVISNESHYAIIICKDGNSKELIDIFNKLQEKRTSCLIITMNSDSSLFSIRKNNSSILIKNISTQQDIFFIQILYKTKVYYYIDIILVVLYSKDKNTYENNHKKMEELLSTLYQVL